MAFSRFADRLVEMQWRHL
nr:hypothetical protein [Escherichia coli]